MTKTKRFIPGLNAETLNFEVSGKNYTFSEFLNQFYGKVVPTVFIYGLTNPLGPGETGTMITGFYRLEHNMLIGIKHLGIDETGLTFQIS